MPRAWLFLPLSLLLTGALACSDSEPDAADATTNVGPDGSAQRGDTETGDAEWPAGPDTGFVEDAGTPGDDASVSPDAGTPAPDATPVPDATPAPDASPAPDAGLGPVPGADTTTPFPIDRGDDGAQTPGSYKGLALRLIDTGEPTIAPVDGKIGVVCIGMSNATQECSYFITQLQGPLASQVNPQVVFVDCAVSGNAIERWNDPARDSTLWDECINTKIPAAGLQVNQIRVIYHKAANQLTMGPSGVLPPYPDPDSDYFNFYDNLTVFGLRINQKLPSVQAVYTTSRMYGGFSSNEARGEPLSYEEGHALNAWLEASPLASSRWFGWGPYIWAPDCASGETNGSGYCYNASDLQSDGVHPDLGALTKISQMMHARFSQHAWYRP